MGHSHAYTETPQGKAKTAAVKAAFQKLTADEQLEITRISLLLANTVRCRPHGRGFGTAAAVELVGKLGMYLEEWQ